MPFSWVRIPCDTSPKIQACTGTNLSKQKFADCVKSIVEKDHRGRVESLWVEKKAPYARVCIEWYAEKDKQPIFDDLDASEVIDVLTPEEFDLESEAAGSEQSAGSEPLAGSEQSAGSELSAG
jgi:hypothetical protein